MTLVWNLSTDGGQACNPVAVSMFFISKMSLVTAPQIAMETKEYTQSTAVHFTSISIFAIIFSQFKSACVWDANK